MKFLVYLGLLFSAAAAFGDTYIPPKGDEGKPFVFAAPPIPAEKPCVKIVYLAPGKFVVVVEVKAAALCPK